MTYKLHT